MLPRSVHSIRNLILLAFLLLTPGWTPFYAQGEIQFPEDPKVSSLPSPTLSFHKEISRVDYLLNEGEGYEWSSQKIRLFLKKNVLTIWEDNFNDPSQSGFVPINQMRNWEGQRLKPEKSVRIFKLDLNDDKTDEIIVIPNLPFGNPYRPTILQKSGSHYIPLRMSKITGDYYEILDVRDLNGDRRLDFILYSSAGASSYEDVSEVFWHDGQNLKSQVFNQWVRLRDFDETGIFQLLVDSVGGTAGSHAEWAGWTDIYKWNGEDYENANVEYAAYYEQELIPKYVSEILDYAEEPGGTSGIVQERMNLIRKAQRVINQKDPFTIVSPLQAAIHNQKGMVFLKRHQTQEAIKELTQAIQWDSKSPDLLGNLVQAYLAEEDYRLAEKYSFKLMGLISDLPLTWKNLGYVYAKQHKKDQAVRSLKIYLQLVPDGEVGIDGLLELFKTESDPKAREALQEVLPTLSQEEERGVL
jgi:hypothetical protein